MITFGTAREALEAGEKFFVSPIPCKNNHTDRTRRISVNNRWVTSRCVACQKETLERFKASDTFETKRIEAVRKWNNKNPTYGKEWKESKIAKRPFYNIISSIRSRSISRGIPFDLDEDYLSSIMPDGNICPIMLVEMVPGKKGTNKMNWISVDRIDPSKGYVRGNVAIMSFSANAIKQDCVDPEVFLRMAEWLKQLTKL